jgi:cell division protein FtsQ
VRQRTRPASRTGRARTAGSRAVVPAGPRLAARAQTERGDRRRRGLRRALWTLGVLVPLGALGWLLLLSGLVAVQTQTVAGTARLTPAQVLAAAAVEPGTPLALLDTGAAADRVAALPPVAQVQVRRVWPGGVAITVEERTPVAGVVGDQGALLLDAAGVPFATERALPAGVVRLQVHDPGPEDPATRASLAVHAELPPALRSQVRIVRAESPSAVQLRLRDGRTVVWGAPGDTDQKASAAAALLRLPGTVFDVSAPGVVTRS